MSHFTTPTAATAPAIRHGSAARRPRARPAPTSTITIGTGARTTSGHSPAGGYAQPKRTAETEASAAARRAVIGAAGAGTRHFPA